MLVLDEHHCSHVTKGKLPDSIPIVNTVVILIAWNLETLLNTACRKAKEIKLVQKR